MESKGQQGIETTPSYPGVFTKLDKSRKENVNHQRERPLEIIITGPTFPLNLGVFAAEHSEITYIPCMHCC